MTGFRGRIGFYELLQMSEAARLHIHPKLDADALRRQALADGMHPLRAAGVMKVAEGLTTLDEVLRTTPAWEG
jgi:general secretion pathway protein E